MPLDPPIDPGSGLFPSRYLLALLPYTSSRNSLRVLLLVLKPPSMQEVTVRLFCFWTPRIIMQKCCASMMTPLTLFRLFSRVSLLLLLNILL